MKISKIKEQITQADESVIDPIKKDLNSKFFDGMKLKPRIRKSMLNLFNFMISKLPFENKIQEYILEKNFVGSMTSFQWSDESDIDLHLVVDDEQLAEDHNLDSIETLQILRNSIKKLNDKFYMLGYQIEFYIQGKNEPFYSDGVYNIEYNTWIKSPTIQKYDKEKVKEAKELAKSYKKYISKKITSILKKYKKNKKNIENLKNDLDYIKNERERIREERNKAIYIEGSNSIINMKFSFLRRLGILKKLKDVEEKLETIIFEIVE